RRPLTSSAISLSPKLSCARRSSITSLSPALRCGCIGTQELMVELADLLESVFELLVIVEPAPNFRHQFVAQAELTCATAGIRDGQNRERVAFATGALLAIGLMPENGALQQRAAQDFTANRQSVEQLLACTECLV